MPRSFPWKTAVALLVFSSCEPAPKGFDARDVRGNYALTYDNQLKLSLYLSGGVREVTATGYGNVVDFGTVSGMPLKLDLTQWCERPEIQCPSETFWQKVAIDQPDLKASGIKLQRLLVVNDTVHTLDAGVKAQVVGGLVNNEDYDRYLIGLGATGAASGACGLLGVSLAGGRFTREGETTELVTEYRTPKGAACNPDAGAPDAGALDGGADAGSDRDAGPACGPVQVKKYRFSKTATADGIGEGTVLVAWAGGCAFGPIVAGGVLTLETGFTGTRTGAFDPPPFTPVPAKLPDGGIDAGLPDGG